jgi:hypothetical protein
MTQNHVTASVCISLLNQAREKNQDYCILRIFKLRKIMRSILHLHKLLMVVGLLLITVGCTQAASTEPDTSVISKDYQSYSKDGLSLKHPEHWSLIYDDNDSLLADRDISLETPIFSKISVLIYDKSNVNVSEVAEILKHYIRPNTDKNIQDFQQIPVEISGFKGYRLTWINKLLGSTTVEMTILKSSISSKPVFAVFNMLNEDIEKESPNFTPFLKSISLH